MTSIIGLASKSPCKYFELAGHKVLSYPSTPFMVVFSIYHAHHFRGEISVVHITLMVHAFISTMLDENYTIIPNPSSTYLSLHESRVPKYTIQWKSKLHQKRLDRIFKIVSAHTRHNSQHCSYFSFSFGGREDISGQLITRRIFTMDEIFIWIPNIVRRVLMSAVWFANHLTTYMMHIIITFFH